MEIVPRCPGCQLLPGPGARSHGLGSSTMATCHKHAHTTGRARTEAGMAGTVLPTPAGTDVGWGVAAALWHHHQARPLTSSGLGLEMQPAQPFPPPAACSTVHEPLPPGSEQHPQEELIQHLATTTGLCYTRKTHGGVLGQPHAPLPAPLWKVHRNKDPLDKLQLRAWRLPLVPRAQSSETRHQFSGWPNLSPEPAHQAGPQPFTLAAHHTDGASKSIIASTENKPLAGSKFFIRDGSVLRRLDPYSSVTCRDIRAFTLQELHGYAQKDALTYWQFEGYPKAWGHGLREPPLGKDSQPQLRPPGPPSDRVLFPSPTHPCRLRMPAPAVPHRGALSLAQESYGPPTHSPGQQTPLELPPTICPTEAVPQILAVPLMYRLESQNYGSRKPGPI